MLTKTPDYYISECGCPQIGSTNKSTITSATVSPGYNGGGQFFSDKRIRLLPRRESLSEYYDRMINQQSLTTDHHPNIFTNRIGSTEAVQTSKQMKCTLNEVIKRQQQQRHTTTYLQHHSCNQNTLDKRRRHGTWDSFSPTATTTRVRQEVV